MRERAGLIQFDDHQSRSCGIDEANQIGSVLDRKACVGESLGGENGRGRFDFVKKPEKQSLRRESPRDTKAGLILAFVRHGDEEHAQEQE